MTKFATRKAALIRRMDELTRRLQGIEAALDAETSADWDDRAQEHEGDEVLERLGLSAQDERRLIQAALARIETGAYGTCARCGEAILDARLNILPYTPLCRICARQATA